MLDYRFSWLCYLRLWQMRPRSKPPTIIRNGLIVTADGRTEGDLRNRNGTIAEIGPNLTAAAGARVIEAKGMLVLPGGIDPHVHLTPTRTATTLS